MPASRGPSADIYYYTQ